MTKQDEILERRIKSTPEEEANFRRIYDHLPDELDTVEFREDIAKVIDHRHSQYQWTVGHLGSLSHLPFADGEDLELATEAHRQCRDSLLEALIYAVIFEWDTENQSYAALYNKVETDTFTESRL